MHDLGYEMCFIVKGSDYGRPI